MTKKETAVSFPKLVEAFSQTHTAMQRQAVRAVDASLVARNWLFGLYIVEYEQYGSDRAAYGKNLIKVLAEKLRNRQISGVSDTHLKIYRKFYLCFPPIGQTLSDLLLSSAEQRDTTDLLTAEGVKTIGQTVSDLLQSADITSDMSSSCGNNGGICQTVSGKLSEQILQTVSGESETAGQIQQTLSVELARRFRLSWSHYAFLLTIDNRAERDFYEQAASRENWSLRELKRQFDTAIYERIALSRRKLKLPNETTPTTPAEAVKDPYVLEFLELADWPKYSERELETALIDKLQHFLLELGTGFLFQSRQYRFTYDEQHFRVDLVFYHRLLRCFVLIDLKIGKLIHQDLGQMQMYVNYFDRQVKTADENPTVGIVLCKTKNDALVEMTLPKQNQAIFASKYQLYLPSKAELRAQLASLPAIEPAAKHRHPTRKGSRR